MAENLLQNRHVDRSGADMAIENPKDQINRDIVNAKKVRFVADRGLEYSVYNPKKQLIMQTELNTIENIRGMPVIMPSPQIMLPLPSFIDWIKSLIDISS